MLFQPAILNDEGFSLRVLSMSPFPMHWHNDIEILHCISGRFGIAVRGKSYTVCEGDTVLCGSCVCNPRIRSISSFAGNAAVRIP